ncbi:MAG: hypothetical protein K8Q89_07490 [Nitrosarchaeum sp.]|nr:hypothetical protein [Nitrosarchaeum sp.]
MNKNAIWGIFAGITTAVIITLISSNSLAQMAGHDMDSMGGSTMEGSTSGSMMSGSVGNYPGVVQQMCHPEGNMPPHYCEPSYMVMSSVRGLSISTVDAVSDNEVMLTVKQIGSSAGTVSQKLVVVGGSGNLAGATVIDGDWTKSTMVHLKFDGFGTIYDQGQMHIHLFPYTGQ